MPGREHHRPEGIGRYSPASGSAKKERIAGTKGGPQAACERPRVPKQPQTSGRWSARREHPVTERRSFAPEEDPELQGAGAPHAERVEREPRLQGLDARNGSHRACGERTEEAGQRGEPAGRHTRHGRQKVPGRPHPAAT